MKPRITDILAKSSVVCSVTQTMMTNWQVHSDKLDVARSLFFYVCDRFDIKPAQSSRVVYLKEPEIRTYLAEGRKRYSNNSTFREKSELLVKAMSMDGDDFIIKDVSKSSKNFYTEEEERMIRSACMDAALFMQHYGHGKRSHPDGSGYYK